MSKSTPLLVLSDETLSCGPLWSLVDVLNSEPRLGEPSGVHDIKINTQNHKPSWPSTGYCPGTATKSLTSFIVNVI